MTLGISLAIFLSRLQSLLLFATSFMNALHSCSNCSSDSCCALRVSSTSLSLNNSDTNSGSLGNNSLQQWWKVLHMEIPATFLKLWQALSSVAILRDSKILVNNIICSYPSYTDGLGMTLCNIDRNVTLLRFWCTSFCTGTKLSLQFPRHNIPPLSWVSLKEWASGQLHPPGRVKSAKYLLYKFA